MRKWTILNVYFLIFILLCLLFTLLNWKQLSREEGWGIIYMIGLILVGLGGLGLDVILNKLIKNNKILFTLEVVIALVFSFFLIKEVLIIILCTFNF